MGNDVLRSAAHHVETVLEPENFRYINMLVANCRLLALEVEAEDAQKVALDALILAAYFHNISTATGESQHYHLQSARQAVIFLQRYPVPQQLIQQVEQAILWHTTAVSEEQRAVVPLEGQILYDANQLVRLSGLAVATSLIEFGAHNPDHPLTSEALVGLLREIEGRFHDLYQSLNTAPARRLAEDKFRGTIAFLEGVIEQLNMVISM